MVARRPGVQHVAEYPRTRVIPPNNLIPADLIAPKQSYGHCGSVRSCHTPVFLLN